MGVVKKLGVFMAPICVKLMTCHEIYKMTNYNFSPLTKIHRGVYPWYGKTYLSKSWYKIITSFPEKNVHKIVIKTTGAYCGHFEWVKG
jgi:hypothetical protein